MNGSARWLCKGFLDLVFRRVSGDGVERYSILDWKSDLLGAYDADSIEAQIQKMNYNAARPLFLFPDPLAEGFFPRKKTPPSLKTISAAFTMCSSAAVRAESPPAFMRSLSKITLNLKLCTKRSSRRR